MSNSMSNSMLTVAGSLPIDLGGVAAQLRRKIDAMDPADSLLAVQKLAAQSGVSEVLVVVRTQETPHIHPEGDLLVFVIEGGGYFQLDDGTTVGAPAGSVAVIPKGVCHAFHNTAPNDTVLVATFSPINSKADCPPS
jgi:quercetin dioxygenase-like cupin family protein